MSILTLRTVLVACAISGALVFACGEDTSSDADPSSEEEDEDSDAKKKDASTKKDASAKKDASTKKDAASVDDEDDDGDEGEEPAACTPPAQACTKDGKMGVAPCVNGMLGECLTMPEPAQPGQGCPNGLECSPNPLGMGAFCGSGGRPPSCTAPGDCADMGLETAQCMMIPMIGGFCILTCDPNSSGGGEADGGTTAPKPDAGSSGGGSRDSGLGGFPGLPGRDGGLGGFPGLPGRDR